MHAMIVTSLALARLLVILYSPSSSLLSTRWHRHRRCCITVLRSFICRLPNWIAPRLHWIPACLSTYHCHLCRSVKARGSYLRVHFKVSARAITDGRRRMLGCWLHRIDSAECGLDAWPARSLQSTLDIGYLLRRLHAVSLVLTSYRLLCIAPLLEHPRDLPGR